MNKTGFLYLLDISLGMSKGSTKCSGSKVYLVVLSKIYESVTLKPTGIALSLA